VAMRIISHHLGFALLFISCALTGCNVSSLLHTSHHTAWDVINTHWSTSIDPLPPEDNSTVVQPNWSSATPFLYSVTQYALDNHVPSEAALLPFLLSHYNNQAQSTPEHQGLWQIKRHLCSSYGLICTEHYDERLHPIISTQAVMQRMKILYAQHKSWSVAFNAFYKEQELFDQHALRDLGSFDKALRKIKYLIIHSDPQKELPNIPASPFFEYYNVAEHVRIVAIGQLSEIDYDLWHQLNSFYLSGYTLRDHHQILVPVNASHAIKIPRMQTHPTSTIKNNMKMNTTHAHLLYAQQLASRRALKITTSTESHIYNTA